MTAPANIVERMAAAIQAADDAPNAKVENVACGLSQDVSDWGAFLAQAAISAIPGLSELMSAALDYSKRGDQCADEMLCEAALAFARAARGE